MVSAPRCLARLALLSVAAAAALPSPGADNYPRGAQAVYFMSNADAGNRIHALPVGPDGKVAHGRSTSSGGDGGRAPAMGLTDALNSQGALGLSGNRLLVPNAGSNTFAMLAINPFDPLDLTLVGDPVDSMGDFPNAVAVSDKLPDLACVSNTGTRSGIACFKMTNHGLVPLDKKMRLLPLTPVQTTPPQGPFNTVSQIFFTADGSALIAMVKGDPTQADDKGYLAYFPVKDGLPAYKSVNSSPAGTLVLFGSVALPNGNIFTTDASFGAAVLALSPSTHAATTLDTYKIPNQGATCWAVVSPATGLVYTTDDGINQVQALDPLTAAPRALTLLTNGNNAMIEIVASGSLLYALTHGNATVPPAVIVMQTLGQSGAVKGIQNFHPRNVDINVEGMAVWPA